MIPASADFITAMSNRSPKKVYVKLEIYSRTMQYLYTITSWVCSDELSNLSCDRTRPIRRSFSFALDNSDGKFSWGSDRLIWLDKRVKLFIGLKLPNGTIEYIPQGVYILTDLYDTHNISSGKKCFITGQDKSYLMNDRYGKLKNPLEIAKDLNVGTAIKTIATQAGETQFNFDAVTETIPFTHTYEPGDNYWTIMSDLAIFAKSSIYYDIYGNLRLKRIDLNDFTNYPETWIYEYQGINGNMYGGNERRLNPEGMANHILVLGGSGSTATCSYELIVSNTDPLWSDSPYAVEVLGDLLYLHNGGSPDPLLSTADECKWRAKFELMNRLGFSEEVPIFVWPNYLHEPEDIIKIIDPESGINYRYIIDNYNLPLNPEQMTINCRREIRLIDDWDFI